ncbi:MAG: 50S ribosomal protein L9 [Clostridia bacterium]
MKVVLLKDVATQGKKDDIIEVSDGYARNYLFRLGLAEACNDQIIKQMDAKKKKEREVKEQERQVARRLAQEIKTRSVVISAKKGEGGRLFGSVTSQEIIDALNKQGYSFEKKIVVLPSPLKTIGEYSVTLKLYAEISTTLKVIVE